MNEKRRLLQIFNELINETNRDGYFGRKGDLEKIVRELGEELEYLGVIQRETL